MELVPMTVVGVPSMHICLDFAPELLSQPSLDKQVSNLDISIQSIFLSVCLSIRLSFVFLHTYLRAAKYKSKVKKIGCVENR